MFVKQMTFFTNTHATVINKIKQRKKKEKEKIVSPSTVALNMLLG